MKRTLQIRIDNTPHSPSPEGLSLSTYYDLNLSQNLTLSTRNDDYNDSLHLNSVTLIEETSTDYHEQNHLKKDKSIVSQLPLTTTTTALPSIPLLINTRKDPMNVSHSSFSTVQSLQPIKQQNAITGTARQRSPTKSGTIKPRTKSYIPQTNLKTRFVCLLFLVLFKVNLRKKKSDVIS